MSADRPQTVWLLGAGFSKPLGGPLFTEVLSDGYMRSATAWVAVQLKDHVESVQELQLAARFYAEWLGEQWRDAEAFLDVFDQAKTAPGMKLLLEQLLRSTLIEWTRDQMPNSLDDDSKTFFAQTELEDHRLSVDHLRKRAQQLVAITTSAFFDNLAFDDERVELYERWFSRLTANDTIVSLNYDRVIETLAERTKNGAPKILKLHGTVPGAKELVQRVERNEGVPEIGLPGPGKRRVALDAWEQLPAILNTAEHFVAMGYSFPQTDVSVAGVIVRELTACKKAFVVAGPSGASVVDLLRIATRTEPFDTRELCERFFLRTTRHRSGLALWEVIEG